MARSSDGFHAANRLHSDSGLGGNYVRLLDIERKEVLGEWVDPDRVAKLNEEIDAYYRANYPQAKGGC